MTAKGLRIQQENIDRGKLKINVRTKRGFRPIENAVISVSYTGNPQDTIEEITTDSQGTAKELELSAPPIEFSLQPDQEIQPYSEYSILVRAGGYEPIDISGIEILSDTTAVLEVRMQPLKQQQPPDNIVIPAHTLYGNYPPKIPEAEIKPITESGEIVLSRVVVPEYVVVHDGSPNDSTAANYYVKYKDYIKNVASSEIYATWPQSTIEANILAIMSFTLNRVYTEWYRNKGFDFTITSSTAYDHKWIYGRNIFDNISETVDKIFTNYLSRPNVRQPILTQYCDGNRVTCPNWMSQWGSKALGDRGYAPIEILRNYYGDNMYINTAEEISGIPSSWPGYDLTIGSRGEKVRQMQEQLNAIGEVYTSIPYTAADGIFGINTQEAVRAFQDTFGLGITGIVDYPTWYKISEIYVAVSRIAELS